MPINPGDTYLIPSGPTGNHLFVVCTGASENGMHLLVSICTVRDGRFHDEACIIEAGEHPFVKNASYVAYSKAESRSAIHIEKCVEKGSFIPRPPVSDDVLAKVIEGFHLSDFTQNWVYEFLDEID